MSSAAFLLAMTSRERPCWHASHVVEMPFFLSRSVTTQLPRTGLTSSPHPCSSSSRFVAVYTTRSGKAYGRRWIFVGQDGPFPFTGLRGCVLAGQVLVLDVESSFPLVSCLFFAQGAPPFCWYTPKSVRSFRARTSTRHTRSKPHGTSAVHIPAHSQRISLGIMDHRWIEVERVSWTSKLVSWSTMPTDLLISR